MRTHRPGLLAAIVCVLATVAGLVCAPAASAAGTAPLAPVDLHPDGTAASSEQYVPSPVAFHAGQSPSDPVGAFSSRHYQVQRREGSTWTTVVNRTGPSSAQFAVADGPARWRARLEAPDGTPGPWSAWIAFTVDSRVPADPVVTLPNGPETVGVPIPVTVTSPDGLAAVYYLSDQDVPPVFGRGQDPCTITGVVCVPAGQTTVTVPWTFLRDGIAQYLYVTAYGRSGLTSRTVHADSGSVALDDAALATATRWSVPTTATATATTLKDVVHGMPLRVAPNLAVSTQQLYVGSNDNKANGAEAATFVDVPSALLGSSATMRTLTPVVDTTKAFSVAAVLTVPSDPHGDLAVVDQAGDGGSSFSLVLTSADYWKFCVDFTAGGSTCSVLQGAPPDGSDLVIGRYDPVQQKASLATGETEAQGTTFGTVGAVRPATGSLRFGVAVPRPQRYAGPVGSPLVAQGWLTSRQLLAFFAAGA